MTNVKSPAHPPFSITVFHNNYREIWRYMCWVSDQAQEKEGGLVKLEWWRANKINIRKRQELGIQAHQAWVTAPHRQWLPGIHWGVRDYSAFFLPNIFFQVTTLAYCSSQPSPNTLLPSVPGNPDLSAPNLETQVCFPWCLARKKR